MTGIYIENHRIFGLESDKVYPYSRCYYGKPFLGFDAPQRVNKNVMKVLTDRAVGWLKGPDEKPFFLYFAPVAVHHPITPSDAMRGESGCGPYGDFIQDLDLSIGRVVATVEAMGVADNTLVIVTSDNGGDIPGGKQQARPENIAQQLGLKINGDLKGDKHTIWQGGVRVPFVVRWPKRLPAGKTCDAMVNLVDVFATLVELLDGEAPAAGAAPDSVSFAKALMKPDSAAGRSQSMVTTDARGLFAIRRGAWKYMEGDPQNRHRGRGLYHLVNDPAESRNVIAGHPDLAAQLQRTLDQIRNRGE
jgi:arylsulfatase A